MSFVAGGHRVRAPLGAKRKPTTSRLTAPNQEQEFKALRRAAAVRDNVNLQLSKSLQRYIYSSSDTQLLLVSLAASCILAAAARKSQQGIG